MRKTQLMVSALLLVLLLGACAPKTTPTPVPQAPAAVPQMPTSAAAPAASQPAVKEAWQVKWDSMVAAAKKEGKVVIYTKNGAEINSALWRGFKDTFGIVPEFIAGQGGELSTKILAERRAGLRLGDVGFLGGIVAMTVMKPAGLAEPIEVGGVLILPEFKDPKLWLGGALRWQDATTHQSLMFGLNEFVILARNTELVKEREIQSYNDLLDPKWKGKIVMRDPTKGSGGTKAMAMIGRYIMGWDYVRALAKQEPLITTDIRLQVDWLTRGKYPLSWAAQTGQLYEFKTMGLPVDTISAREGGYLTSQQVNLLKEAAHPNAARLFINWLLTKEGQTAFSRASGWPSLRLDVSDEGLIYPRLAPDSKAPNGDSEEAVLMQNEDLTIIKTIFK